MPAACCRRPAQRYKCGSCRPTRLCSVLLYPQSNRTELIIPLYPRLLTSDPCILASDPLDMYPVSLHLDKTLRASSDSTRPSNRNLTGTQTPGAGSRTNSPRPQSATGRASLDLRRHSSSSQIISSSTGKGTASSGFAPLQHSTQPGLSHRTSKESIASAAPAVPAKSPARPAQQRRLAITKSTDPSNVEVNPRKPSEALSRRPSQQFPAIESAAVGPPKAGPAQPRYYAQHQNTAAANNAAADVPAYEQWTVGTEFTAHLRPGKVVGGTSWRKGVLTFPGSQAPPVENMAKLKTSLAELANKHNAKTYVQCIFKVSDRRYRHDEGKQIVGVYITAWNASNVQSD